MYRNTGAIGRRALAVALAAAPLTGSSGPAAAQVPSREYVYAGERLLAVIPPPGLSIDDVAVMEGHSGTRLVTFTVRLSATLSQPASASYATANGTASAGSDYQTASGTVTVPAGANSATISVNVIGDTSAEAEPRETFFVNLGNPVRAALTKAQGQATIIDDEAARYYPLALCRLVDTRNAPGPSGGPAMVGGSTRQFPVVGVCGVPANARAVATTITTTAQTAAGNLRMYPAPGPLPPTSAISFAANKARANNAIVTLGQDGRIAVTADLAAGQQTHVIVDVAGYFR